MNIVKRLNGSSEMKAEEAAAGAEDTSDSRRTVTRANASHWIHQLPGKSKAGNIYPQTQPETPRVMCCDRQENHSSTN